MGQVGMDGDKSEQSGTNHNGVRQVRTWWGNSEQGGRVRYVERGLAKLELGGASWNGLGNVRTFGASWNEVEHIGTGWGESEPVGQVGTRSEMSERGGAS